MNIKTKTRTHFKIFKGISMKIEIVLITLLLVRGLGMTALALNSVIFPSSQYLHYEQRVSVERNDSTSNNIICDNYISMESKNNAQGKNKTGNCSKQLLSNEIINFFQLWITHLAMILTAAFQLWVLIQHNKEGSIPKIHRKDASGIPFRHWLWIGVIFIIVLFVVFYFGMKIGHEENIELHVGDFIFINDISGMYFFVFITILIIANDAFRDFAERRYMNFEMHAYN